MHHSRKTWTYNSVLFRKSDKTSVICSNHPFHFCDIFSGVRVTFFSAVFLSPAPWPTGAEGKQGSTEKSGENIVLLISLSCVKVRCCLQRLEAKLAIFQLKLLGNLNGKVNNKQSY